MTAATWPWFLPLVGLVGLLGGWLIDRDWSKR